MSKWKNRILAALLPILLLALTGCAMTVDEMYCLPIRSESYYNLQAVMDEVMEGLDYSAPTSGDNQQTVQMADLDGDGVEEVILFAEGTDETPLKIVVFRLEEETYQVMAVFESTGTDFDQVEYVQLDGKPGLELVVGRQVSDQILRNVAVYRFSGGQAEQLMTAQYRKFVICDLDENGCSDLLVLCASDGEQESGNAVLYTMQDGRVERSAECVLSQRVENLKRIMTGDLSGGQNAVFVASLVDESAIVTDVLAMVDGSLTNLSFSNESGTSVKTLRNYYVYADDIDHDGEVELPDLISMAVPYTTASESREHLIRWYSMAADGAETDKMYTYHNYLEGWYMELDSSLAKKLYVVQTGQGSYSFCVWNEALGDAEVLWTVYVLTGEDRSAQAAEENRFVLLKTDAVVYAAQMGDAGLMMGISQDDLTDVFHLIQSDWKTGEM